MAEVVQPRPINPKAPPNRDPNPSQQLHMLNGSVGYVKRDDKRPDTGMWRSNQALTIPLQTLSVSLRRC